ncbi:RNA-directed DNA polymerase [Anoxynatronum sibiricum]|uniref:RNA-directed DNA polymerase n=1 Tax=Anoxynatronum sibiricum TaxID=210623 RepID=A0ABU9VXB9_9CLOT
MSMDKTRKFIINLTASEARKFLLKAETYCGVDLPPYFVFEKLIQEVNNELEGKNLSDLIKSPRDYEDVNYTILNNKDGKYAWRPFQLIHPVLYVSLARQITEESNWMLIFKRFQKFSQNDKIRCLSIPVISLSEEKDNAEQVSHWWHQVEQRSIELALEYDYLFETDITDCYGSIYTHSIAWALHTKTEAKKKENRNNLSLIGNQIDKHIQDMRHGQTNGIPQGSPLMDFIAEMVLGYADLKLSEKIQSAGITEYLILRYRDDYRIFCNNPREGEEIIKFLTEITISLGLKLNPSKTQASNDVIRASIKTDKIAWFSRKKTEKSFQKHLLIIHDHSLEYPNTGSLAVALQDYYHRIKRVNIPITEPLPIISIVVDIAYRNPRTYAVCSAILSVLLNLLEDQNKRSVIEKIQRKFTKIPNTGYLQIWLQRITLPAFSDIAFEEPLCKLVIGESSTIWNSDWISSKDIKKAMNTAIIDSNKAKELGPIIPAEEFALFIEGYG